eukprot:NODE_8231_length_419_cov_31.624324_g7363_i0.p4 GENE.NODE_8231_length_419_cov_31.624324_g7363_i0~~NODE_8231_length_419_cov_31.624324_g7363_i0.p4  ORF type:complete len:51 (-),score=6.19 NODE_8231_length_419_cov_31.624324_g7363_i0:113-265(-)
MEEERRCTGQKSKWTHVHVNTIAKKSKTWNYRGRKGFCQLDLGAFQRVWC